jgi:hypothetical protein
MRSTSLLTALVMGGLLLRCGSTDFPLGYRTAPMGEGDAGGATPDAGPTTCDSYDDEQAAVAVSIRVSNATDQPIYLGIAKECDETPLFSIRESDGTLRPSWVHCGEPYGCWNLRQAHPGCTSACQSALLVRIDPGGSHDLAWDGRFVENVPMPATCYHDPADYLPLCSKYVSAPPRPYQLSVTVWSDWKCGYSSCQPCSPTPNGTCVFYRSSGLVTGTAREASIVVDYAETQLAEIRFD